MDQALIERLLTAASVEIAIIDPARAEARHCIHSYFAELDRRLRRFARWLRRGELEGVELRDGRLHVSPVKATTPPEADALADRIDAMLPHARITEVMHEVSRATGFAAAFTNLRTGERCDNENALLATILADDSNLGLTRMAAASQGVTRDQLIWIADAYIRPETYKAALARIINAHHALPIAAIWGDGSTSSSDGQFFRSAKRGDAAGEVNARYGHDPGFSFYTHLSDQHGPYNIKVMSATNHEAPYVLDGLLHHGTQLNIGTHYTDTGGASDHVFILCAMLGFRFCPRLRDLPDRKLACIELASAYKDLQPAAGPTYQGRRRSGTLGRDDPSDRIAEGRHRGSVHHAQEACSLLPTEPTRPGASGTGADRTHTVHARLAGKPSTAPTLPRWAEQERTASFPRAGHLHLQARSDRRPRRRGAAVPRIGAESGHRRDRLLELDLHRRCGGTPAHRRRDGARSVARPHDTPELGAHRPVR